MTHSGAARIRFTLDRLTVLASALMIAAHPDDENTALLAYLTRGRKARAAYLSLTRGEGGQNLIGPERSDLLGLIRTQELLAARSIDDAEQYFSRAIDFAYSKTAAETLDKWGHEAILADVVWIVRRFRPDVMVQVFSEKPTGGHGHHQASAILAGEAFTAAADPSRFPEQLRWVEPWQATRLLECGLNRLSSDDPVTEIDAGQADPLLGFSYAELAGISRGMHRTQGMDAPERRGVFSTSLAFRAGEPLKRDIFEGIDTTWSRVSGGAAAGEILQQASREFLPEQPGKTIPHLLRARPLLAPLKDPWAALKLRELDAAIALCAGLELSATAPTSCVTRGQSFQVNLEARHHSVFPLVLKSISVEGVSPATIPLSGDMPVRGSANVTVPSDQPYSQPYWLSKPHPAGAYLVDDQEMIGLAESPPLLNARFSMLAGDQEIEMIRPVVTPDTTEPLTVVPAVSVKISETAFLFPDSGERTVDVVLRASAAPVTGELVMRAPWQVQPTAVAFRIEDRDKTADFSFTITPPCGPERAQLHAVAMIDGLEVARDSMELIRTGVRTLARRIGYVMGAGDEIPHALRQLGCEVILLSAEDLGEGDLSGLDAIVTGVRAYNQRPELRLHEQRLLDYMQSGGTLVVQYNVADGRWPEAVAKVGPYPLRLARDRVTNPDAPVTFLNPNSPLLSIPNRIGQEDFQGWVQERGLYFAAEWDPRYEPLFECHDDGEGPLKGATLHARCGQGAYVFTAFSWFRQLPGGVPGAFRIFANLLSAGKI